MMELLYFGIILLGRISFETKFFKTFFSDIDAREAVLWAGPRRGGVRGGQKPGAHSHKGPINSN